ncbi:hypothetical protein SAMN05444165_2607 [Paraburkholderia phenazinium]|uniref:Uncharacterized protein n=1 Tax=Paraburkholderia phenazinium TaxID=60549 RepID=A0A1N6IYB0_9BURK|nr:hypothetical protein SAMN05444165_2607 [Paraburkholderia phenazinium]
MPRETLRGNLAIHSGNQDSEWITRCLAQRLESFHETLCKRLDCQDLIP